MLQQADLLQRVGRPESAAPLLEQAIGPGRQRGLRPERAGAGPLEQRLADLDGRNAALRTARARAKNLARTARALADDYKKAERPLRAYTFARAAGTALADEEGLLPLAEDLRKGRRESGLLRGSTYRLNGARGHWTTIFNNPEQAFEHSDERLVLEAVRPTAKITTAVPIRGEYRIRAKLVRGDERRSSF